MIVLVAITWGDGARGFCTGFMIGPHAVGTAAHCVHLKEHGGFATAVAVIPGQNSSTTLSSYGAWDVSSADVPNGWIAAQTPAFDYAVLQLPNDLGLSTGYFGLHAAQDAELLGKTFSSVGYRADKPFGTLWAVGGPLLQVDGSFLYYNWGATHGESGSPILELDASGTGYNVVGIITNGFANGLNLGPRVNATVFDFIEDALSTPLAATGVGPQTVLPPPAPPVSVPPPSGATPTPSPVAAIPTPSPTPTTPAAAVVLSGFAPHGTSLWVLVRGGSLADVQAALQRAGTEAGQCTLGSLTGGRWVLYIAGAPAAVNGDWLRLYPGTLPDGLALWSRCP